jgi:hypothetical protein
LIPDVDPQQAAEILLGINAEKRQRTEDEEQETIDEEQPGPSSRPSKKKAFAADAEVCGGLVWIATLFDVK